MSTLTRASLQGALALNGLAISQMLLRLIAFVWLSRLLSPDEFGLAAIAIIFVAMACALNDAGMSSALVRRTKPARTLTLTVFWSQIAIGVVLLALVLAVAPLVGWMFGRSEAVPLVRLASLAVLSNGIAAVPNTVLQKAGRFSAIATAEFASSLIAAVLAMTLASLGAGPYAALTLFVVPLVFRAGFLLFLSGLRPRLRFSLRALASILPYSINLLGEQLVNMVKQQVDRTIIGVRLGAPALGEYQLASQIFFMPIQVFVWGSTVAFFPTFAKLRQDAENLAQAYLFASRVLVAITFPIYVGLAFIADELISLMVGGAIEKWGFVAPILSILCVAGLAESVGTFNGVFLQTLGRSRTLFHYAFLALVLVSVSMMIGVQWGLLGAATAYALSTAVSVTLLTRAVLKAAGLSVLDWLLRLGGSLVATVVMLAALILASIFLDNMGYVELPILIVVGVLSYTSTILLVDPGLYREVHKILRQDSEPLV